MRFDFEKFRKDVINARLNNGETVMGLRECAEKIGISAPTLNRIEAGKTPDIFTLCSILEWMGKDANEYFIKQ